MIRVKVLERLVGGDLPEHSKKSSKAFFGGFSSSATLVAFICDITFALSYFILLIIFENFNHSLSEL